jgi:hypothetical protein
MRTIIVLVGMLLAMSAVCAAERPSLEVTVTGADAVDKDAAKCGITNSDIRAQAVARLLDHGVSAETEKGTNPRLHIGFNVLYLAPIDACIASIIVELLGATDYDNKDSVIGEFRSTSQDRATRLAVSEYLLIRKLGQGLDQLIKEDLAEGIKGVMHKVTHCVQTGDAYSCNPSPL